MSTVSNLIFHDAAHALSSPYGYRNAIKTSAGTTGTFHNGCDYATYGKKLPQYAIEDGTVLSCGIDYNYGNAKFVWVSYPRLKVKMMHYHLDSINVKAGQSVNKNTILGYTGQTGRATGIHLHLGIKRLSGGSWIDPEAWSKNEYTKPAKYTKGNYEVTTGVLHVRKGPGTNYKAKTFKQFTKDARTKILELAGYKANGYVEGVTCTVSQVKGDWGKTPSGWICLKYCKKI